MKPEKAKKCEHLDVYIGKLYGKYHPFCNHDEAIESECQYVYGFIGECLLYKELKK